MLYTILASIALAGAIVLVIGLCSWIRAEQIQSNYKWRAITITILGIILIVIPSSFIKHGTFAKYDTKEIIQITYGDAVWRPGEESINISAKDGIWFVVEQSYGEQEYFVSRERYTVVYIDDSKTPSVEYKKYDGSMEIYEATFYIPESEKENIYQTEK